MNTHYSFIKKSVILGLLCAMTFFTAFAESSAGYIIAGDGTPTTPEYSTCIPTKKLWVGTYPTIPYHLQGMENECHLFHWYTSGDLRVDSISADSLTAYVSSVSTNFATGRDKDYAKGRLYVTYEEKNVSWICGDPVKYYDIYKTFKDTVPEIVGPDCINEGDTVTFSIEAMVSYNINSMIGIDRYYWDWSDGLVDSLMYYSGDSSSITFIAGPLTGHDTIFVDMGQCNLNDNFRYTKILGQAIEDPIFATGFEPSTCMPFGITRDTIIISNPQDDVTYDWDLGSWKEIYTSEVGDTIIFAPASNALSIELSATGPCETKDFEYMISRTLTSQNKLNLATKCLVEGDNVVFSVTGVPDGTEMTWSVTGTDWVLDPADIHVTQPTITVGSDTGFVSVRTKDCDYTLIDTILIKPNIPGEFIDPDTCLSIGDISSKTYKINKVANANSYEWELPSGWTGSSVDTFIVATPNGTNVGMVKVRAVGCSNSDWKTLNIAFSGVPPTGVSGLPSCINAGMPDTLRLSVTGSALGQKYNWKFIPESFGVVDSSGVDSSTVKIYTGWETGDFKILVRAFTNCDTTAWDTTEVSITKESFGVDEYVLGSRSVYGIDSSSVWVSNHIFQWIYNGGVVTDSYDPNYTTKIPSGLLTNTDTIFYVTVKNLTTGCLTRKTGSSTGFRSATAINEPLGKLSISPNPTDSRLTISLTTKGNVNIWIMDMAGNLVKKFLSQQEVTTIDVSDIPNGNYMLVAFQNKNKYSKQFIIKK